MTYRLSPRGEIIIDYEATTSAPTAINLTNHTYWNLSGNMKRKILDQMLALSCSRVIPVNEVQIPIGEYAGVEGTPFDFRIAEHPGGVRLRDVLLDIDG